MRKFLTKIHLPNWLVGVLAMVLLLRVPSFFEPYSYGDEMIYLTLGQGIRQGLTLYTQIFDNKPPLIYLVAAIAGNLFWFKAILAFWNMATVIVFAKLAEKLLPKGFKIATIIFALATTLPLLEGNIANAELFILLPSLGAFMILLREKLGTKKIFLAGALFGISTLFKVPAAFDLAVVIVYWFLIKQKDLIKNSIYLSLGFAAPILLTFIWYFFAGALPEYFRVAFLQNIGYLGSLKPPIDIPIYTRALAVLIGLGVIFLFRNKLSKHFILFSVWALFSLFAAALSQRPYPHYLIQVTPAIAFLLAMFFSEKSKEQALVVIPLAAIAFVPFFYKYYDYKTIPYYVRFVNFAIGKIDKDSYLASFSKSTARNYELANFLALSSKKDERVFVWDPDSPIIYALSRRLPPVKFTAPYHVFDYSNKVKLAEDIAQNPPKFIVLTSGNPLPEIVNLIARKYILIAQIDDANVYSKVSGITF